MITPLQAAQILQGQYDGTENFDISDRGSHDHALTYGVQLIWGAKGEPDQVIVAFEGSHNAADWFANFRPLMVNIRDHEYFGPIAMGFNDPWRAWPVVKGFLSKHPDAKLTICGHSRGGAEAAACAAYAIRDGVIPDQLFCFAPPRVGTAQFANYLKPISNVKMWRNQGDPVPHVPATVPFLLPYADSAPMIDISVPAPPNDAWGLLAAHHLDVCYMKGLQP